MPIYEFYCPACHRLYSFLSRTINPGKAPACPRCGKPDLARRASLFAVSRGRKEPPASEKGPSEADDARLEQVMQSLAGEAEGLDENDPRQAARLMRKVFEASGMSHDPRIEEAFRRMESGEDPEKIEEEMGDLFDAMEGSESGGVEEMQQSDRKGLAALRRRLPPTVDSKLYEM